MKISKIFGFVLCLHLGVITVLIVQPGCRTTQPPTQSGGSFQQDRTLDSRGLTGGRTADGLIPATRSDAGLDPAFNAGFEADTGGRSAPRRPSGFESDFGIPEPELSGPTVDVAGPSTETYTVKRGDSLWAIAKRFDVSVDALYAANNMNENSVLRVGQQIDVPVEGGTARADAVTADSYQPSNYDMETESYTVRGGDTLSKIANQFDTSVRAIKAANNKESDIIRVGETLVIPVSSTGSGSGSDQPSASSASSRANAASASSGSGSAGARTHTVKAGEYPATIARQYGMTSAELLAMNGITDPRKLQVGQKLKVSSSGSAANVDSRTETVAGPASSSAGRSTASQTGGTGSASASASGSRGAPVPIRVVEADPLVESEAEEIDTDSMFESAVEIPVIRMEDDSQ